MASGTAQKIVLLVGTRKGGFVFHGSPDRRSWTADAPFSKGSMVHHIVGDERTGRWYAAVSSDIWASKLLVSTDQGKNWNELPHSPRFPEGNKRSVKKVWNICPGRNSEPGVLYAGVEPASLFRSTDNGDTWTEVEALDQHESRNQWTPGAGGLMAHSIVLDHDNPQRMWVAISAAGTFRSDDGGVSWTPKNKGVRADFLPNKFPAVGQCVHKLIQHPSRPDVLFQQNHCGVYRSDNAGDDWVDLCEELPARFGFPIVVHPHKPETIYVIPEESDEVRVTVGGRLAVWRSEDSGRHWSELNKGLPAKNSYQNVLREAMATDREERAGIYFGTATGQLCASVDDGNTWRIIADWLPPIYSVEVVDA